MACYALPVFLGAFLLFQVQPLIGRYILPWFGGTPSVWTTCMLFFQVLLVGGYAYAHVLASKTTTRRQALIHTVVLGASVVVLAVLTLVWHTPISPDASWKPPDSSYPLLRIIELLTVAVGVPYFVLATTSPLLQAWFTRAFPGVVPYRLYALSNAGSLLALVSYPFVVEPALGQRAQAMVWFGGYLVFAGSYAVCAVRAARLPASADVAAGVAAAGACESAPTTRMWLAWLGLPALASVLLLATTNHMCQEVAVIPFLWIVPLSLYLLSFILCFENQRWYQRGAWVTLLMVTVPIALLVLIQDPNWRLRPLVGLYSVVLLICCMVCHGELVRLRPAPRYLTAFYLAVSIGGALGGLFVGLLAPVLFRGFWELHLGLAVAWVVGAWVVSRDVETWPPGARRLLVAPLVICLYLAIAPLVNKPELRPEPSLATSRNFYGVLRVADQGTAREPDLRRHALWHGRTKHGDQFLARSKARLATTYYGPVSGVGLAILYHPRNPGYPSPTSQLRIGVVGLGTGTLAAYGRPGDYFRFYEINPRVVQLATDNRYFRYLGDCPAEQEIVIGDARLSLERELAQGSQQFDILALDAFSSDAVPAHLLTEEAFRVYFGHLREPDGILAVHISNRVLDLRPVVWGLGKHFGLWRILIDSDADKNTYGASWVLLSRSKEALSRPELARAMSPWGRLRPVRLWTDDDHSLFPILK